MLGKCIYASLTVSSKIVYVMFEHDIMSIVRQWREDVMYGCRHQFTMCHAMSSFDLNIDYLYKQYCNILGRENRRARHDSN